MSNKTAIMFVTHIFNEEIECQINKLRTETEELASLYVVYQVDKIKPELPDDVRQYGFTIGSLNKLGYTSWGCTIMDGNFHFVLLDFYRQHPEYDYYWLIEYDVHYTGNWSTFFNKVANDKSDLLSTYVRSWKDEPSWGWWATLETGNIQLPVEKQIASFNPVYRLSNQAMSAIDKLLTSGWQGHNETIIPTIVNYCHLSIGDMRNYNLYTTASYSASPLQVGTIEEDILYHPVKRKMSNKKLRRNCVITAAGSSSIHENWISGEDNRSFDLHVIVYDNSFNKFYEKADFMGYGRGQKLKLVYAYLKRHPEYLLLYDYFFIPDDDIETDATHIEQLFYSMEKYHLQIAQPSLRHSFYTYSHTLRKHYSELRYTNFVEMMMPCFSRDALVKVLDTFDANDSGWGVEFHWSSLISSNHHDMGVLDNVSMIHTKPVSHGRIENAREMKEYINKHHLSEEIVEYDYIPNIELTVGIPQPLHFQFRQAINQLLRLATLLEHKLGNGSITREGLDGRKNTIMLLKIISFMTEARFSVLDAEPVFDLNQDSNILELCQEMFQYSEHLAKSEPSANHDLLRLGWNIAGWLIENIYTVSAK
ncbi:MAG: DUF707 domain-containing protein [Prevotella sp.]|nr:DUF707 domain-containing protein [Prevotella sp.]